jgi:predicted CoA-binding protein
VPVHPSLLKIEGVPVVHDLADVEPEPDVLTIYVKPETSSELAEDIVALRPKVVIFNPGAENPELESRLSDAEIRVVRACTIMLLTTGRFGEITGTG